MLNSNRPINTNNSNPLRGGATSMSQGMRSNAYQNNLNMNSNNSSINSSQTAGSTGTANAGNTSAIGEKKRLKVQFIQNNPNTQNNNCKFFLSKKNG